MLNEFDGQSMLCGCEYRAKDVFIAEQSTESLL